MSFGDREPATRLLSIFAYGSIVSTYILILLGVDETNGSSGLGCGESRPLCRGGIFPSLNKPAQVIEFSHRIFNLVVAFFVIGTALLAWTRYRPAQNVVLFSTASFVGLFAQVILGMVTVTSDLNPIVSAAHLGLASAVFALVVVNAVMVWNLRSVAVGYRP